MEKMSSVTPGAAADTSMAPSANVPVSLPIYQSAGWVFGSLDEVDDVYEGRRPGVIYGGSGGPNQRAFEARVAELHGAESALVTSAGMAAFPAALLTHADGRSRVVAAKELYGNTSRLLEHFRGFGVETEYVDAYDLAAVESALSGPTAMLVIETISNPRVRVADVSALAQLAHAAGAKLVVDNTLASPYHCRPLELGADLVIESAKKFVGGHHDIVLGCLIGRSELLDPARMLAARAGLVGAAFECWLATRSLETLDVRMARSSANALVLAQWLARQPKVQAVHYPGSAKQAHQEVAARTLQQGFGSVVSFELAPDRDTVNRFIAALQRVKLVLTFGGVETSLSHPATSSHRALSESARAELGIHEGFLRMSVGVEDSSAITRDLEAGLGAI